MTANEPPPIALDAEQGVLGSMLISPADCIPLARRLLRAEHFRHPSTRKVYEAILALESAGRPSDLITLTQHFRERETLEGLGIGDYSGAAWIMRLIDECPSPSNLAHYAEIVREHANLFTAWKTCRKIIELAANPSTDAVSAIAGQLTGLLGDLTANSGPGHRTIAEAIHDRLEAYETAGTRKPDEAAPEVYSTGIPKLDAEIEGGLKLGDYIVVSAKTSGGKTALVGQIAVEMALNRQAQALIVSYEMREARLVDRMLTLKTSIPGKKLRSGNLDGFDMTRLAKHANSLANSGIHLRDRRATVGWTVEDVASEARAIKAQHGLHLLIVDYLQLVPARVQGKQRVREVADTSRALISLAGELNIIVIGLSQLNDDGKLFESRSIGFDADLIITINDTDPADKGKRILYLGKRREGERDVSIEVDFFPTLGKFA